MPHQLFITPYTSVGEGFSRAMAGRERVANTERPTLSRGQTHLAKHRHMNEKTRDHVSTNI